LRKKIAEAQGIWEKEPNEGWSRREKLEDEVKEKKRRSVLSCNGDQSLNLGELNQ